MTVVIEDRPTESVREEVIDQLIMNYSHGKLSYEAFERRLDNAMESSNNQEISDLASDLDLTVDKEYVDSKKRDLSINYVPGNTEELDYMVNIFSGSSRSGPWKVAKEIRSFSVFSGSDIDFTDAQFSTPEVRIKMFCLFSGDTIYIPENVNVISKVFCIFGGFDNNAPSTTDKNAPTIIIEGLAIFSGVTIDVKRSLKEKFISFADGLKKLFS